MEEGWENFLDSNVNSCIEVVDKHRHKNVLVVKSRSVECGNCGTYSVVDDVKNLKQESIKGHDLLCKQTTVSNSAQV